MFRRFGSGRLALLDALVTATDRVATASRTFASLVTAGPTRWRPTDLYAAAATARFMAAHHTIELASQAAADSPEDPESLVSARTWPWLGGRTVYLRDEEI